MKTTEEYGKELFNYYILWKSYEGALKREYERKIKETDALLRASMG